MTMQTDKLKANLSNAQRTYLWEVLVPNPLGGGDGEAFTFRCQSASRPGRSVGTIKIEYKQGPGFKIPGKNKYDQTWNLTVLEGEDGAIHDFLYGWQQQMIHDTTELGTGDSFLKRDIYLKMLSSKGEETKKIKLIGAFPQSVPEVALSMTGEDVFRFTVTFSFDKWVEA